MPIAAPATSANCAATTTTTTAATGSTSTGIFGSQPFFSTALRKEKLEEELSPHRVTIVILIKEYVGIVAPGDADHVHEVQKGNFSVESTRALGLFLLKYTKCADIPVDEIVRAMDNEGFSRTLKERFVQRLVNIALNGVHNMHEYLTNYSGDLQKQLGGTVITSYSVAGLFLRRMFLSLDKMPFDQVLTLYNNLCKYIKASKFMPAETALVKVNSILPETSDRMSIEVKVDVSNNCDMEGGDGQDLFSPSESTHWSARQARFYISKQEELLRKNEGRADSSKVMSANIVQILKSNPQLAEAHYLSFLNYLRIGDWWNILQSLHHYFDVVSLINPEKGSATAAKTNTYAQKINRSARYGLLNLTGVLARSSYKNEAYTALIECLHAAQEAADNICLQHALSWQYLLERQNGVETLFERALFKAGEYGLFYLASMVVQAFVKYKATRRIKPASVFVVLTKSDVLNCQNSQIELMLLSYAQKSALWKSYGKHGMSLLDSQLLLHLSSLSPLHHKAYQEEENFCLGLCQLALHFHDQGEGAHADSIIKLAVSQFPPHTAGHCTQVFTKHSIKFDCCVRKADWEGASDAINAMAVVNLSESQLRKAILATNRGQSEVAYKILSDLKLQWDAVAEGERKKEKNEKPYCADLGVRILLAFVDQFCKQGCPSYCLAELTTAGALCEEYHLDSLSILAIISTARVLYLQKRAGDALLLLDTHMLKLNAHRNLYDQATTLFLYCKCCLAVVDTNPRTVKTNVFQEELASIAVKLKYIVASFKKLQAFVQLKDVFYFQAMVYHQLSNTKSRNEAARNFKVLNEVNSLYDIDVSSLL